jgi:AbrB family looped-hinge helix DNA binding protein
MRTASVKVGTQYRISIPKKVRRQLKIKSGDHLAMDVQNGMIILLPVAKGYTQALAGLHREIWKSSDAYIDSERRAWANFSN